MSRISRRRARRPAGKARRPRIPGVFERGATQPAGMHRPSNAARLSPRAVNVGFFTCSTEETGDCYEVLAKKLRLSAAGPGDSERFSAGHGADDRAARG